MASKKQRDPQQGTDQKISTSEAIALAVQETTKIMDARFSAIFEKYNLLVEEYEALVTRYDEGILRPESGVSSSRFEKVTTGFLNNMYAAIVAFAFAFAYEEMRQLYKGEYTNSDVTWQWLLILGAMALIVDDWFGSRHALAEVEDKISSDVGLRRRFAIDLILAVLAYPMILTAAQGLQLFSILVAVYIALGGVWSFILWRSLSGTKDQPADKKLFKTFLTHFIAAAALILVLVVLMVVGMFDAFGKVATGARWLGIFVPAFVLTLRINWGNLWSRFLRRKSDQLSRSKEDTLQ